LTLGGTLNLGNFLLENSPDQPNLVSAGYGWEGYAFPIFEANTVNSMFSNICYFNGSSSACGAIDSTSIPGSGGSYEYHVTNLPWWGIEIAPLTSGPYRYEIELVNPEPHTYLMIGGALLGLGLVRRRRRPRK